MEKKKSTYHTPLVLISVGYVIAFVAAVERLPLDAITAGR